MKPNAAEREKESLEEREKEYDNVKVALVRMYRIEISFC